MKQRRDFELKIPLTAYYTWAGKLTVDKIRKCKELLDTDVIQDIQKGETKRSGFGMHSSADEEPDTLYAWVATVLRNREETDEEYVERVAAEAKRKREAEEKERMQYLTLKAKYDTN